MTTVLPRHRSLYGDGYAVQRFCLAPKEAAPRALSVYSAVLHLGLPVTVEWVQEGRSRTKTFQFGDVSLHSPGDVPGFRLKNEADLLEITLSPAFVRQALQDDAHGLEVGPLYGVPDPRVQFIGLALTTELEAGCPGGTLFCGSLAAALAAHLFSGQAAPPFAARSGGLPRAALRRVAEFVHAHLDQDLTLTALAALTSYSPHHFALLFKQSLGVTPHQFVVRARIEEARRLLASTPLPLGEIAYSVGFASQSHFHHHFKRLTGVTPTQYRNALQR